MKRTTLIVIFITLLQFLNAQDSELEDKLFLGGSLNFLVQKNTPGFTVFSASSIYADLDNDSDLTSISLSPAFGKEINNKFFLGVQLNIGFRRHKVYDFFLTQLDPIDIERNSTILGGGIFTRHILNPNNQLNFFVQPNLSYYFINNGVTVDRISTEKEITNSFELGAGLGLMYNINSRMRATVRSGGFNYINGKTENEDSSDTNAFSSFGFNLNLSSIFIGFEVRL